MRKSILISIVSLLFFSCTKKRLLPKELELVNQLNFDVELMSILKNEAKTTLSQLPKIDQETSEVTNDFHNGISTNIIGNKQPKILVERLKHKFKNKGYLVFLFTEDDFEQKKIGVLKGNDELDILRYRKTNGANYDFENDDIVSKLSGWKKKYGLNVVGCGLDWLQVTFDTMPEDLNAFSKEVYDFCPDSVDQGVGNIENLKELIKEMNGVWLWWD